MAVEIKTNDYKDLVYYVQHNLKTFKDEPFNDVDALVFAEFVYLFFHEDKDLCFTHRGCEIKDLLKAEYYDEMVQQNWSPDLALYFLSLLAGSPRFRNVVLNFYRNEINAKINLQFGAITATIADDLHLVIFRGTDGTLTGWKEDALLALNKPIPAQILATEYLESVAKKTRGALIVLGHSKGGNLAVYAGANCKIKVQERIKWVYSFDGPGFYPDELKKEGYVRIKDRCKKFVPQFSIFGLLFQHICEPQIIHSNGVAIMQHSAMTWEISGNSLSKEESLDPVSKLVQSRLDNWLYTLNDSQKAVFVQGIFDLLDSIKIKTIDEISENIKHIIPELKRCIDKMEPERRKYMQYALALMVSGKADMKKLNSENLKEYSFDDYINSDDVELEFPLFI